MSKLPFLIAALLVFPLACGDEDDDDGDESGNTSPDSTATSGNESGNTAPQTTTTSTMETCMSDHVCVNGACTCQTPGLENQPCTDDTACEDECEICM